MNRTELVEAIVTKTSLKKSDVEKVVKATFELIPEALLAGETVQLNGFGVFKVSERKSRNGVNPRTGEKIEIPAKKTITFKMSKSSKEDLNKK